MGITFLTTGFAAPRMTVPPAFRPVQDNAIATDVGAAMLARAGASPMSGVAISSRGEGGKVVADSLLINIVKE